MEQNKLQEDLLREFKEGKNMIENQLSLLDPLAVSLRKPIASRLFNTILLISLEVLAWLAVLATIAFAVFRDKFYPFYILARLRSKYEELGFSKKDMDNLYHSSLIFCILIAFLFIIIARNIARIRKKNKILQMAGKTIKTVVGDQLKRKAALDTVDQRHFGILEPILPTEQKSTAIPNPGY
jgi:hypothetical protein